MNATERADAVFDALVAMRDRLASTASVIADGWSQGEEPSEWLRRRLVRQRRAVLRLRARHRAAHGAWVAQGGAS